MWCWNVRKQNPTWRISPVARGCRKHLCFWKSYRAWGLGDSCYDIDLFPPEILQGIPLFVQRVHFFFLTLASFSWLTFTVLVEPGFAHSSVLGRARSRVKQCQGCVLSSRHRNMIGLAWCGCWPSTSLLPQLPKSLQCWHLSIPTKARLCGSQKELTNERFALLGKQKTKTATWFLRILLPLALHV